MINKILTLLTTDCVPIFIYDKIKKNISLIHSGWRGLSTGIFFNAMDILFTANNNIKDFKFVIGPSIKKCCYEVDIKVYSKFDEKFYELKNLISGPKLEAISTLAPEEAVLNFPLPEAVKLDVSVDVNVYSREYNGKYYHSIDGYWISQVKDHENLSSDNDDNDMPF